MAKFFWSVYVVASVLLGVFVGHLFFRAFDAVVPPAVVTSFNRAAAYSSFLFYGAVLGGFMALWGFLAFWLARLTAGKSKPGSQATPARA